MSGEHVCTETASDGFEIFDAVCVAAGVRPGAERIGLFLELPRDLQERLWIDASVRLKDDDEETA